MSVVNVIEILDSEIATRHDAYIAFKAAGDSESAAQHAEDRDRLMAARWAVLELIAAGVNYRHRSIYEPAVKRFDDALEAVGVKP